MNTQEKIKDYRRILTESKAAVPLEDVANAHNYIASNEFISNMLTFSDFQLLELKTEISKHSCKRIYPHVCFCHKLSIDSS